MLASLLLTNVHNPFVTVDLGIVIKWENMQLKTAVHYSYQILSLTNKASKHVLSLLDPSDVCSYIYHLICIIYLPFILCDYRMNSNL